MRELLQRRDGGPLEARYGRLRDRLLAAGVGGLSLGSEAVKDVTGNDLRRLLLGSDASSWDWAVFRLARLPERRERLLARGGDAFALAEALRADPAEPAALVVLEPGLLAIADDCGDDEQARRRELVERCARAAGAELEAIDEDAWLALCARPAHERGAHGGPRRARRAAGARGRLGLRRRSPPRARHAGRPRALAPVRPAPPASRELVAAVVGAVRRMTGIELTEARRERFDELARQCVSCGLCLPSLPDVRPARGRDRTGRAAGSTSCSASWPATSRSRTPAGRSIAASAAAPARRPARPTCSTASCSRSRATAARRRRRCRCARCSSLVRRPRLLELAMRAGRPLARFLPGAAGRSGKSLDAHAPITWERRRPGGPAAVVLRGCVMREAFAGVQQAAVDSLAAAGYDVDRRPRAGLLRRAASAQRRARDG